MFDDRPLDNQTNNQADNAGPAPTLGGDASAFGGPADNQSQGGTVPSQPLDSFAPTTPAPTPSDSSSNSSSGNNSQLDKIKTDALAQLSPLVNKLDQSPEEKYKTLMMMVQASDNQDLLPEAYEAAQKITDEKLKAEALLNIVNEVNYFNQKANS